MRVLFARIGYMHYYAGSLVDDERPVGGGSYNQNNIGHEVYNFKDVGENLFGYFQPYYREGMEFNDVTIDLQRIDPTTDDSANYLDDVLVIFFANIPHETGQRIVGWYKHARVYRSFQTSTAAHLRDGFSYNVECATNSATLIFETFRDHQVAGKGLPKQGRPGQSNAFYVYDSSGTLKSSPWIQDAIDYVNQFDSSLNLLQNLENAHSKETAHFAEKEYAAATGQAFNPSVEARKLTEQHSMDAAVKYFKRIGFDFVADRSSNHSYDLEFTKNNSPLYVEVKGTQTKGQKVFLTKNEVIHTQKNADRCALFVLHSIQVSKIAGNLIAEGGVEIVKLPWALIDESLKIVTYEYTL